MMKWLNQIYYNAIPLQKKVSWLLQIKGQQKQNFETTRMSSFSSLVGSYINQTVNLDVSKSPHHKKDVILRFLRLSVFVILIVIVFFLIYRVRDLYQQHLKYQRLQRDEAEVSWQLWIKMMFMNFHHSEILVWSLSYILILFKYFRLTPFINILKF